MLPTGYQEVVEISITALNFADMANSALERTIKKHGGENVETAKRDGFFQILVKKY